MSIYLYTLSTTCIHKNTYIQNYWVSRSTYTTYRTKCNYIGEHVHVHVCLLSSEILPLNIHNYTREFVFSNHTNKHLAIELEIF